MSANTRKGTEWESKIRDYALARGLKSFRWKAQGVGDEGDVHMAGFVCIQAKDDVSFKFSQWVQDVMEQKVRAGLPFGWVVAKRRSRPVGKAYAITYYEELVRIAYRLTVAETMLQTHPQAYAAYTNLINEFDGRNV